jgi:diphthamide synthase (EF-2-diphthine--ammonia ligase)
MIRLGVKARLTCIDSKQLAAEFVGREFDEQLLADLPSQVDPCGENGEFHTCVYAGPMFNHNLRVKNGEIVTQERFVFSDLVLV